MTTREWAADCATVLLKYADGKITGAEMTEQLNEINLRLTDGVEQVELWPTASGNVGLSS